MVKSMSFNPRRAAVTAAVLLTLSWSVMTPQRFFAVGGETETEEASPARQDGQIVLSTDYPGVSVKPGASASFSLYLTNGTTAEADAALTADGLPEGWSGYFRGSDSEVSSVHLSAGQTKEDSPTLTYNLTVPEGTEEGDYSFTLKAEGDGVDAETKLTVTVSTEDAGESNFAAKYAEQEGASGTSFSFDTTLTNNSAQSQSYSLSSDAPEGWTVSFTPSGESTSVTSLPIDAGAEQSITVAITPADTVTKGDYTITLTARSAEEELTLPLTVSITGTYGVTFSTPSGNLSASAYAGEEKKVTLTVTNSGNIDLENLSLSGTGSTDWNITFDSDTIDSLKAGETKDITAAIQPAENAVIGDYVTQLTVSNDAVKSELDLRVSVKNHTTWGVAAIAVIAVLAVCLGLIIRKYGRR